ncbi:hypothetical protein [Celeribacter indicus]|uniref:F5/8 type C domain-containing protein n=1 Tax=Celeribacter indicus TaxID=1208324 RepID=A0A0B5E2E2_9RHOB|nr:hypothetical protein [Celeribacter indicus]AJE47181.1 hypothetical protein P73_2466 [Celeribacter indicus]SDW00216.1 hypothetical protein SAMN05443573_10115 [Celeribacter indicus]
MRDLYNNIVTLPALAPAVHTAAATGAGIDTARSRSAAFVVSTGAVVGSADFGVSLQESDDGTSWKSVDAAQVQSNAPATLEADSAYRLGYLGSKRYVRLALTRAGGTSLALGAVAALEPLDRPAA